MAVVLETTASFQGFKQLFILYTELTKSPVFSTTKMTWFYTAHRTF